MHRFASRFESFGILRVADADYDMPLYTMRGPAIARARFKPL
jgi:hypothetical protein